MRFISVNLDPGRVWSDYGVIDTSKNICICKSSDCGHSETIAKVLNMQWLAKGGDEPVALLVDDIEAKHDSDAKRSDDRQWMDLTQNE